jgi:hypothetical protein
VWCIAEIITINPLEHLENYVIYDDVSRCSQILSGFWYAGDFKITMNVPQGKTLRFDYDKREIDESTNTFVDYPIDSIVTEPENEEKNIFYELVYVDLLNKKVCVNIDMNSSFKVYWTESFFLAETEYRGWYISSTNYLYIAVLTDNDLDRRGYHPTWRTFDTNINTQCTLELTADNCKTVNSFSKLNISSQQLQWGFWYGNYKQENVKIDNNTEYRWYVEHWIGNIPGSDKVLDIDYSKEEGHLITSYESTVKINDKYSLHVWNNNDQGKRFLKDDEAGIEYDITTSNTLFSNNAHLFTAIELDVDNIFCYDGYNKESFIYDKKQVKIIKTWNEDLQTLQFAKLKNYKRLINS